MTINFYCLRETSLYNSSSRNLTTTTTRRNFQIHPKLSLPVTSPTPPSSRKVKPKTFRSQIKSLCSAIIIMRKRTSQIAENRRHEGGVAVDTARGRGERERERERESVQITSRTGTPRQVARCRANTNGGDDTRTASGLCAMRPAARVNLFE